MSQRRTEVKKDIKSGQKLKICCVVTKQNISICIELFYLVYWELEEESVNIHTSAELISPEEYPEVYGVRDNCLVNCRKENYKGVGS